MRLDDYLRQHRLKRVAFGRMIGRARVTIYRWSFGRQYPSMLDMLEVRRATGGAVNPDDFAEPAPALPGRGPPLKKGETR